MTTDTPARRLPSAERTPAVEYRPWPHDGRYLIGDDGSILGLSGKRLRSFPIHGGYLRLRLSVKGRLRGTCVHVAVAETFHGLRPAGMQVAHGNGDPADNRAENLRWATPARNNADKVAHDTLGWGERHGNAKLTAEQVHDIRTSTDSLRAAGRRHGVNHWTVSDIRKGRNWSRLTDTEAAS